MSKAVNNASDVTSPINKLQRSPKILVKMPNAKRIVVANEQRMAADKNGFSIRAYMKPISKETPS